MIHLIVTTRDGREMSIAAPQGHSLMEAIRDHGCDDLLAICGGGCSCATCHVHVDPDHLRLLPPIADDEADLLAGSAHRGPSSRLACQIMLIDAMDGMRVAIAPED